MKRILDLFSSVKLTLTLLLGLALAAVFGTIWPLEQGMIARFDLYYQTVWFRLLLAGLVLNLAACTWRTGARVVGERERLIRSLASCAQNPATAVAVSGSVDAITARLRDSGYRVEAGERGVLARKGLVGRWSLPLMHLAILLLILGAWASQLGFVGTLSIYVNQHSDSYFDWDQQADRPLGFTFRLDHFEPRYYPIELRFATFDENRRQLAEYTAREGETVVLSPRLSVRVLRFDPDEKHLVLGAVRDGVELGEYHALSGDRSFPDNIDIGVTIKPTAYRDPRLKQLHSEVSILEGGQVVKQGVIEVNTPLVYRGVAIYQTAYNRDESGFWVAGFQLSKDPGEPLMWGASVVLVLTLLLVFWVRFRALAVVVTDDGCRLLRLAGFRGAVGEREWERVLERLRTTG
jgi:cytochrome c biogenesis protein